jgi:5-methyltetrahydropteroyltriglutamate--homocysteine methyltransferase
MVNSAPIKIPTEPIGSIPRPVDLIERIAKGDSEDSSLEPLYEDAIRDTNDFDSTHSADLDYAELLPSLFELKAGNFYIAMAGERDRRHALQIIRKYRKPDQRVFVGVTAPADPNIEAPEQVRDRVLEATEYIPVEHLGTTDDCGFSPFSDVTFTSRDTAFPKIQARVMGTKLAEKLIGGDL